MGALLSIIYTYGIFLQAIAIVHFIRKRPETFWLWIILLGGGLGALVYLVVEAVPDLGLLRGSYQVLSHRSRVRELEDLVQQNPAPGNYEELGELYLERGDFARARQCFDHAISSRTDSPDPFYRRALCALALKDVPGAVGDLEQVVRTRSDYDFHRAAGLLAHAYASTGQAEKAEALFEEVTKISTLSETQFHYARFLAGQGRKEEARQWAQRILSKKHGLPAFQRRRERHWFRKAEELLKQLPPAGAA